MCGVHRQARMPGRRVGHSGPLCRTTARNVRVRTPSGHAKCRAERLSYAYILDILYVLDELLQRGYVVGLGKGEIQLTLKSKHSGEPPEHSSNFELKIPPLFWKEIRQAPNWKAPNWKTLKEDVIKIFENYAEVLEKGHLLDRSVNVRFKVKVEPGRSLKIISVVVEPKAAPRKIGDDDLQHALAAARERGRHRVAEILSGNDMLSAEAFASLLKTTRMTINSKRKKRQVLALEGATRGFRFPQWQIGQDGKPFSALPKLFERLGNDSWAVYRFLVQHHPELNGLTGREALQRGKTSEAIEAAESVARNTA
jgi:hypothetical protein